MWIDLVEVFKNGSVHWRKYIHGKKNVLQTFRKTILEWFQGTVDSRLKFLISSYFHGKCFVIPHRFIFFKVELRRVFFWEMKKWRAFLWVHDIKAHLYVTRSPVGLISWEKSFEMSCLGETASSGDNAELANVIKQERFWNFSQTLTYMYFKERVKLGHHHRPHCSSEFLPKLCVLIFVSTLISKQIYEMTTAKNRDQHCLECAFWWFDSIESCAMGL